jgi:signal transduction histidine kinase
MTERNPMAVGSDGAQEWLRTLQSLAEQIQKQQATSQEMVQELMSTYMQLLNTPGSYISGQAEQQQQTLQQVSQQWVEQAQQQQQVFQQQAQQQQQSFQQMVQESMSTYAQLFNIPLQYAQQGLQTASLPISNYDDLTVEEIRGQLGNLSTDDLRTVRDYEERTHKRDTLLEQLDRRIRSSS